MAAGRGYYYSRGAETGFLWFHPSTRDGSDSRNEGAPIWRVTSELKLSIARSRYAAARYET